MRCLQMLMLSELFATRAERLPVVMLPARRHAARHSRLPPSRPSACPSPHCRPVAAFQHAYRSPYARPPSVTTFAVREGRFSRRHYTRSYLDISSAFSQRRTFIFAEYHETCSPDAIGPYELSHRTPRLLKSQRRRRRLPARSCCQLRTVPPTRDVLHRIGENARFREATFAATSFCHAAVSVRPPFSPPASRVQSFPRSCPPPPHLPGSTVARVSRRREK